MLERLREERGLPERVICDNGSEFTNRAFDAWAYSRDLKMGLTPAFVIEGQKDPHEAIDNVARQLTPLVGIVVRPQNRDPLGGAGEPVRCHP